MIKAGRMTEIGLSKYREGLEYNKEFMESGITTSKSIIIPEKLEKELKKNKKAWNNFNGFADSYKKMYIFWYLDAKREDTRSRRMKEIVSRSEKNQQSITD